MRVGKITGLELVVVVRKCFIELQARFSSRQVIEVLQLKPDNSNLSIPRRSYPSLAVLICT